MSWLQWNFQSKTDLCNHLQNEHGPSQSTLSPSTQSSQPHNVLPSLPHNYHHQVTPCLMETRPWSSTPDNQSGTRENMTSYHLPDIPYFCGLCGYYFQTLYDLDLHVNNCPLDTPHFPQPNITPEVHEYFSPATEKCTLAINVMNILQSSMTLLYIRKHITQQCPPTHLSYQWQYPTVNFQPGATHN